MRYFLQKCAASIHRRRRITAEAIQFSSVIERQASGTALTFPAANTQRIIRMGYWGYVDAFWDEMSSVQKEKRGTVMGGKEEKEEEEDEDEEEVEALICHILSLMSSWTRTSA